MEAMVMDTTMTYDELFAVGEMNLFLKKAQKHCAAKIGNRKFAGMDKEDVIQEALIKVYRSLDKYDSKVSKLNTFVDHVIENIICDYLRKAGSRKNLLVVNAAAISEVTNDSEESTEVSYQLGEVDYGYENSELLMDVMENMNLSDREKEIFKLRMEGYEFVEIAQKLGMSKSRLSQVWSKIKLKYQSL
jgi:RNA polymerase sporulation-specific sigma factor